MSPSAVQLRSEERAELKRRSIRRITRARGNACTPCCFWPGAGDLASEPLCWACTASPLIHRSADFSSSLRTEPTHETPIDLWYSAAHVLISPSDDVQESFGVAAIQAMSEGASGVGLERSSW
jgi:hypothetical protein